MSVGRYVVVVGHGPELEAAGGAVTVLRSLGAEVRAVEPFGEPDHLTADDPQGQAVRAIVVQAPERPDLATLALRQLRRTPALASTGALAAVSPAQVAQLDPASGFDDFILFPYVPAELYARVRAVEWQRSEFANEERIKLGALVLDRAAHEVTLSGAEIPLTAREFALLDFLCDRRGRVVTREQALLQVWPDSYEGGPRTVDIHVRRLRHKLGEALPIETLRGVGYKLALPRHGPTAPELDEARRSSDHGTRGAGTSVRPGPARSTGGTRRAGRSASRAARERS